MTDLRGQVGARVKQLRQARRLTQEQLAERAGLSYKFIGEVERGRGNPTLTTLASLSEALGVSLIDLLGVLEEKIKGNLTADEDKLFKDTLYQLRMRYLAKAGPAA